MFRTQGSARSQIILPPKHSMEAPIYRQVRCAPPRALHPRKGLSHLPAGQRSSTPYSSEQPMKQSAGQMQYSRNPIRTGKTLSVHKHISSTSKKRSDLSKIRENFLLL